MGYRKFRADYLFDGSGILPPEAVLITDASGIVEGVFRAEDAGDGVEQLQGVLTPGFVNTHCHLELSHMQGRIAPGTGLVEFLTRVIKDRSHPAAVIAEAMQQAAYEMYENGIVAVGDICNTTDSIAVKKQSGISWYNFIEVIGFAQEQARDRLAYAEKVLSQFEEQLPLSSSALSPHAPYSVSESLFGLINEAAAGKTVTIHSQESEAENELYRQKSGQLFRLYANLNISAAAFTASGKSSLQTFLPWLDKAARILLVHNTCTREEDVLFATTPEHTRNQVYFCVCINANRYIDALNPPIGLLRKNGCTITLGTDSYASNSQLSILEEMKTIQQQFSVPLPEMLQWATANGAEALQLENKLGSFAPGMQPGVVLIDKIVNGAIAPDAVAKRIL